MTDKFKDQDSMLPAATDEKKKAIGAKAGNKTKVIINPPEKVDPQRGYQERFKHALEKHSVIIEKKTELVLQSKAARADLPQETLEQVFKRGFKSLPLDSQLTREQYAMNRVNSFIAGGAAMVEDCDLIPIVERAGRPHVKQEKSPYNGKTVFHVVDAKGNIKHSTTDEGEARNHLAKKFNTYLESTLSPMKRFEGTKSLVKTYKDDTPGEGKKIEEEKKGLYYYVNKRKKAGTSRDKDDPKAPSAQDWKNAAKTAKEEVDLSELSNAVLARYKAKAGEQASAADKAGDFKKGNKRFSGIIKATNKQFDNDAKGAK